MGAYTTYICDRCGTEARDERDSDFYNWGAYGRDLILCTVCFEKFRAWMKEPR